MEQPTSPAFAASLIVSATISGESPKPFSRSAETGRSVASQITRAWAIASSRVTRPSRRPSKPAEAPLEVANAAKPSPAIIRAEPPSQTLATTNVPGASCSARKTFALSDWVTGIGNLLHPAVIRVELALVMQDTASSFKFAESRFIPVQPGHAAGNGAHLARRRQPDRNNREGAEPRRNPEGRRIAAGQIV